MLFTTTRETLANFICPEQLNERRALTRLVNIDALTGLANRRAFELALPAAERDPATAIVLFDANNFGKLNKAAGHAAGDSILRELSHSILDVARKFRVAQRAFRIGGDEFVVLCPIGLATAIRDRIEAGFGSDYFGIDISVSGTIGSTLAAADAAIQTRKAARKAKTI